jgi:hypothetical protein
MSRNEWHNTLFLFVLVPVIALALAWIVFYGVQP